LNPICERIDLTVKPCAHYAGDGLCRLNPVFRCIEYVRRREPELSYSQMSSWGRCKRLWYYEQILGIEPIEVPRALAAGKLASEVLDLVHTGDGNPLAPILKAYKPEPETEDKVETMLASLEGTFRWYLNSQYCELRGRTQYPFQWDEEGYPRIRGFLDLVIMSEETLGYEFKFTGNPDRYDAFTVSDQLSAYFIGVPKLQRITLRTISPPNIKPKKNESQAQYIERVTQSCNGSTVKDTHYWRSEFGLKSYKEKARWISKEIMEACSRGEQGCYQNLNGCYAPGECKFLPVCTAGGAISETIYRRKGEPDETGTSNID